MRRLFSTVLLLLVFPNLSFSQNFFPHTIGNKWVYRTVAHYQGREDEFGYLTHEVGRDTVMPNWKRYVHYPLSITSPFPFAREDSNGIYYYNNTTGIEERVFRFDAHFLDSWIIRGGSTFIRCTNIDSITIFSKKVKAVGFSTMSFPGMSYTFAEKFGLIRESYLLDSPLLYEATLQGCIIDGITYGDLTSVEKIESTMPERLNLFPSYPNPFNGQTTVRFSLDKREHLHLAVYDILGREVAVLVEKELEAGLYNTQWGPVHVGSGVYFVRLQTSRNVLSQKIVYMK